MTLPTVLVQILLPMLLSVSSIKGADAGGIGVNYGTRGTTLPPPADVARFLARDTLVDRVRLFDADPIVLQAFAGTGLAVDVTVPNGVVPRLVNLAFARRWVRENVAPYARAANISRVLVGNEVTTEANRTLLLALVPAMQNLHTALVAESLHGRVKVSTTHSLGVLTTTEHPSAGRFRDGYDTAIVKPLLRFLRATGAPFMVNAYPFYGLTSDTLDFALFRVNAGVMDDGSGLVYSNMLDAQLDAVHSAIRRLGFGDVDIVVSETGWPSAGEDWEVGVGADLARDYNKNAIRHLGSGMGTPLMPNRTFEVSIFSLFDENLKPGPVSERNFGLFRGDMTPVYDVGIFTAPETIEPVSAKVTPAAAAGGRQWCVPKPAADEMVLQENIDFACGQEGIDCAAIRPGGVCYEPDTVQGHAAYAMNLYFQSNGQHAFDCDFGQTAIVTTADPSYGGCKFM
ncbi:Glucan endo-1,3-beta-glucosidase [Dichanthelium oligosanthes]|uniref:glucan endo-1,3-beta-D-glucosidase n=1 Tax=Dichanthelium oligosanthes TaxID=888268 RepID=A0A1E5UVK7_9POAL|nr:Glucan endo-1,3-beta-glucosidase [Dichanthelium oligosanthes]